MCREGCPFSHVECRVCECSPALHICAGANVVRACCVCVAVYVSYFVCARV